MVRGVEPNTTSAEGGRGESTGPEREADRYIVTGDPRGSESHQSKALGKKGESIQ